MAFRIQSHFNFVATATLLLLTKSTTAIDSGVSTGHDVCKGLDGVTFNATGTIKTKAFPDFSKGPEGQIDLKEWTWHTGLDGTNLSSPEQYIWVDTTGSVDLNSPESPYNNTCMTAFALDPDADFWNTPQNDTGDCKSMLGADCLSALSSSFSGMTAGDCSGPSGLSNFDDCPILKSYSAMSVRTYTPITLLTASFKLTT
jgi:hypothetical protein